LEPPTVVGFRELDDDAVGGLPNPLELGRSLIEVPVRIFRVFTGWGSRDEPDAEAPADDDEGERA
jgi:hypothetical protein